MSTMRPEASEITGTVRAMSGNTVPVTDNCDGAWNSAAVAIGYNSGCSTAKKEGSTPEITLAGGGASAAAFACPSLHPDKPATETRRRTPTRINVSLRFHIAISFLALTTWF